MLFGLIVPPPLYSGAFSPFLPIIMLNFFVAINDDVSS